MAILTFNKSRFEKDIGKFDEDMQSKVAMFGTPIEAQTDNEIQIEVFPNRPDLLSYHGFKRAFLAFLGKKKGLKEYNINKPEKNYLVNVESSLKNIRPFTACAIVKNLILDDEKIKEIIDMQEKLHLTLGRKRKKVAIGIYPLEKIKLPITFKALEPDKIKFIPLEMDKELSGLEILQRHSAGKDYAHLLAGKALFPVFVDSANQILSMPPIINSQSTGRVVVETQDVFIECSGFEMEILKQCLNLIVASMAEMGAKVYQMEIKYGFTKKETTPDLTTRKMKISIANVNKLLGLELKEKEIRHLLEKMGYGYKPGSGAGTVEIPAWRTDILHEVDIIEDVAIAYGYDKFVPEIPLISTHGSVAKEATIKKRMGEILSGLGFLEVANYHLTKKEDQIKKMDVPEKTDPLKVIESKTEYNILRENLSHFLLKNLSENVDSEYPQKIFEIGRIFSSASGKPTEEESLALAITPGNFTESRQAVEYLFRMIDKKILFLEADAGKMPPWFIDGRTAGIVLNGKTIGYLGEVHPKILQNWRIRMPVALLEIEIDDVLKELIV